MCKYFIQFQFHRILPFMSVIKFYTSHISFWTQTSFAICMCSSFDGILYMWICIISIHCKLGWLFCGTNERQKLSKCLFSNLKKLQWSESESIILFQALYVAFGYGLSVGYHRLFQGKCWRQYRWQPLKEWSWKDSHLLLESTQTGILNSRSIVVPKCTGKLPYGPQIEPLRQINFERSLPQVCYLAFATNFYYSYI